MVVSWQCRGPGSKVGGGVVELSCSTNVGKMGVPSPLR